MKRLPRHHAQLCSDARHAHVTPEVRTAQDDGNACEGAAAFRERGGEASSRATLARPSDGGAAEERVHLLYLNFLNWTHRCMRKE